MIFGFYTLGCKVNQYETEAIKELFTDDGFEIVSFDEKADFYIVNTCSVTAMSDKKSRQIIRRAKKQNPDAVVAVTGCYAQTKAEEIKRMSEADVVLGTANRAKICEIVEAKLRGENPDLITDIMKQRLYEELECEGKTERTRAYIKIQDGCSQFCSYCIIPTARGRVRSRTLESLKTEISSCLVILEKLLETANEGRLVRDGKRTNIQRLGAGNFKQKTCKKQNKKEKRLLNNKIFS